MRDVSPLERRRLEYRPRGPRRLLEAERCVLREGAAKGALEAGLKRLFPRTFGQRVFELEEGEGRRAPLAVGVVFSGGQASGGHNVIAGLWDVLEELGGGKLVGFLDGPEGIVQDRWIGVDGEKLRRVRNQGGFDLLGSGRTKIETGEQLEAARRTVEAHRLDGLVIIGGDDSNTNAAVLAEYFLEKGCPTRVIGVPKTIDGDLRCEEIEISFGFDTACKTYAELIGNIARDALSAKKYYHFIKLMGRSASHIALECALATQPNLALIGEEGKGLEEIVRQIADLICKRAEKGKNYGVILVPEGLVEFVPEIKALIQELNGILAKGSVEGVEPQLSEAGRALFAELPEKIRKQLAMERDPHGNVQVSQIETEQLLMEWVRKELKRRAARGEYKGKFSAQEHFLGYEGRACMPSNFDANYCYALGRLAALAVRDRLTGMICSVQGLTRPPEEWTLKMVPLVALMHLETRKGKEKPVIRKALVDLEKPAYRFFAKARSDWEEGDCYRYPGPIQFFGDRELTDAAPMMLVKGC